MRLFVFEELCTPAARELLEQRSGSVFLGDDVADNFAALRDAHVACAFGAPLERSDRLLEAMWFDIPVVAFDDPIVQEFVEPCGVLCDPHEPAIAASLLYIAASDRGLQRKIVAEERRVRTQPTAIPAPR